MRSNYAILFLLFAYSSFVAATSSKGLYELLPPASSSLWGLLSTVQLMPPYPGAWDFTLAAGAPMNSTWSLSTSGGPLTINWNLGCQGEYTYPVFNYGGKAWNRMCQKGFTYDDAANAFTQYFGKYGLTVEAVQYTYYPNVVMSVSGNRTKLIYSNGTNNQTIGTTPTCAFRDMIGNIMLSVTENEGPTIFTYEYQTLTPLNAFYALSVADPFAGFACLTDGQICWPGLCNLGN